MGGTLEGKRVLVVGRGSGIARAIADVALREGAEVIAAGRDPEALAAAYAGVERVTAERVDLTDDASITNGAADTLTRSLAVELAPIRVNAMCPGVIDTGAWDGLGEEGKAAKFRDLEETIPVPRVGAAEDIGEASLGLLTNSYVTGVTLFVDGGERLV